MLKFNQSNISDLPSNSQSPRILLVDYAKGFGIFLVVLGHTLRGLIDVVLPPSMLTQWVDGWIYAFHIPLFFFLSGLFIERSIPKSFGSILFNKLKTIAYPYFVWSIFQELLRELTGIREEPFVEIWRIIYSPVMQFWFLYALFVISLLYVALRKFKLSIFSILLISLALSASTLVDINLGSWSVTYLVQIHLIYFVLGALIGQENYLQKLNQLTPTFLIFYAATGFSLIALASFFGLTNVRYLNFPLAALGIFSSLLLAHFLVGFKTFNFIKIWGLLSLEIFVAHTIFSASIRVLLQKLFNIDSPAIHILLGTVVGILGPMILYKLCLRYNFPYLFRLQPMNTKSD
jgi:fucose 4-O-acetylase-like acetyltransferase